MKKLFLTLGLLLLVGTSAIAETQTYRWSRPATACDTVIPYSTSIPLSYVVEQMVDGVNLGVQTTVVDTMFTWTDIPYGVPISVRVKAVDPQNRECGFTVWSEPYVDFGPPGVAGVPQAQNSIPLIKVLNVKE